MSQTEQKESIPSVLLYPVIGIRYRNTNSERIHLQIKKIDSAICNSSASIKYLFTEHFI